MQCINFCAGDVLQHRLYGRQQSAQRFAQPLARLPEFLGTLYQQHGITDQVLFGDQRPVHQPAIGAAKAQGVRNHVFEEGYFRPHWITLEREGVNNHSLLPRDVNWYREVGERLAQDPQASSFTSSFNRRAVHDVAYHVAGLFNPLLFPRYRNHAGMTAPVEYAGYIKRFTQLRFIREREKVRARQLVLSGKPFYVLPLQLNTDAQIRYHSQFKNMQVVIEYVMQSFARNAPADSHLIIKNHPLDMGWMNYPKIIEKYAKNLDVSQRVHYLEEGAWHMLGSKAQGVITVNSTAGMVALEYGTPTLALSDPIYKLPGLTSEADLDGFWRDSQPPDTALFAQFRRCVLHATQVNGGFYTPSGIELAVRNSVQVLTAEQSPLERLL